MLATEFRRRSCDSLGRAQQIICVTHRADAKHDAHKHDAMLLYVLYTHTKQARNLNAERTLTQTNTHTNTLQI